MKKVLLLLPALMFLFTGFVYSQANCGNARPSFSSNVDIPADLGDVVNIPSLNNGLNLLPTTELAVTVVGKTADDGYGDEVLGFVPSSETTFNPQDFGVVYGDVVELRPVGYNIGQIQGMIDDVFNNTYFLAPCCSIVELAVPDFCPNLTAGGITSGADIQNLTDVLGLLTIFNGGVVSTVSVEGFVLEVDTLNIDAAAMPDPCGGTNVPICYAVPFGINNSIARYSINELLSIEMLAFEARNTRATVDLTWKTGQEVNNSHFVIERSANGVDFASIGTVDGAGSSYDPLSYKYSDRSPLCGTNYYRLAAHDVEGNITYSDVNIVKRNKCDSFEVLAYSPNPTSSELNLTITNIQESDVIYEVMDLSGRVIQTGTFQSHDGISNYTLGVQTLSSGVYFVNLKSKALVRTFKFIRS